MSNELTDAALAEIEAQIDADGSMDFAEVDRLLGHLPTLIATIRSLRARVAELEQKVSEAQAVNVRWQAADAHTHTLFQEAHEALMTTLKQVRQLEAENEILEAADYSALTSDVDAFRALAIKHCKEYAASQGSKMFPGEQISAATARKLAKDLETL